MLEDRGFAQISIEDIAVPENRLRELRDYSGLASSMVEIGLLQPITVTEGNVLVAGRHRLEAARSLGWKTIPALVTKDDDLRNRLAEIDENLHRFDLTVYEQSKHAEERERVLEALGQRATPQDNQRAPVTVTGPKTTADIANESGMSESSWKRRVKIGKGLGPKTKAVLDHADISDEKQRNFLNSTTQLNTVADIANKRGDDVSADAVERVLNGQNKSIYDAYPEIKKEIPELPPKHLSPGERAGLDSLKHFRGLTKHDPKEAASVHDNRLDPNAVPDEIKRAEDAVRWLEEYIRELRNRTRLSIVKGENRVG